MNSVQIIGRLGFDPKIEHVGNDNKAKCTFRVAEGKDDRTVWIDVEAWNKTAELCAEYLSKGRQVGIEGRLGFDEWDDKQTGKKRSKHYIVASRVTFVGSKADAEPKTDHSSYGPPPMGEGGSNSAASEDLPF